MANAERHGKLIGDFAPHGPGLGEFQVMGLGRCAAANETGLGGYHFEMVLVANPLWLGKSKLALVNSVRAMRGRLGDSLRRIGIHPRHYRSAASFGLPSG